MELLPARELVKKNPRLVKRALDLAVEFRKAHLKNITKDIKRNIIVPKIISLKDINYRGNQK